MTDAGAPGPVMHGRLPADRPAGGDGTRSRP